MIESMFAVTTVYKNICLNILTVCDTSILNNVFFLYNNSKSTRKKTINTTD